ncbi:unnamed protein product [Caenorhabditis nigoni]
MTNTSSISPPPPILSTSNPIFTSYQFFQVEESPFAEEHATPWDVQEILQENQLKRIQKKDNVIWDHRSTDRFQWSGRLEYTDDLMDYEFEEIGGERTEKKKHAMRRAENLAQLEAKREKKMNEKLTRQLKSMKID